MKAELIKSGENDHYQQNNNSSLSSSSSSMFSGTGVLYNYKSCSSSTTTLGNLDGACTEKLLIHCAGALESNNVTLAQQVMWVLNNVASPVGDPNQRLTSWFLRALISRATSRDTCTPSPSPRPPRVLMSVTELAGYVDLIPWYRFGFCASNSAIIKAMEGYTKVHIIDFSITHCMQWPTLIDAFSKRPQGPPCLKLSTVSSPWRPRVPPFVNVSTEEVGHRLSNFAKFKSVPFEFNLIRDNDNNSNSNLFDTNDLFLSKISLMVEEDEALVVNCQNWLRYLPVESNTTDNNAYSYSLRDTFLDRIKDLVSGRRRRQRPCIVTVVDEDSDMGSLKNLTSRITACFNYLWIPFDALETFLPKDSSKRLEYEADIGQKIENIIGFDHKNYDYNYNVEMERHESGIKLCQRMRKKGFVSVSFGEETVREVKLLLDEHSSGWGMKKEDGDDMLVLTWKGHNSIFATAWVLPC